MGTRAALGEHYCTELKERYTGASGVVTRSHSCFPKARNRCPQDIHDFLKSIEFLEVSGGPVLNQRATYPCPALLKRNIFPRGLHYDLDMVNDFNTTAI